MGQHKHNPIAIKVKNGEIKPKEKGMSEVESRRRVQDACRSYLKETFQIYTQLIIIFVMMNSGNYLEEIDDEA